MAIKEHFDNLAWTEWPDADARARKASALESYREQLADKLVYHRVTQYFFFQQWLKLKAYANDNHIEIVGDMPIYVAEDSSDMWANPHLFKTDVNGKATCIADVHQMNFLQLVSFGVTQSMTGKQWTKTATNGGLNACVKASKSTISFVSTTSVASNLTGEIPAGSDTAAPGEWVKGPGYKLFAAVKEELGELNIIAEDLGFMTDEVIELRERTGFPGMKILQFAFNPEDESSIAHTWHLLTQLCTQEHTITTLFLVGTVMKLTIQLVSTWHVIQTARNMKQ